jgi:hypothetical protein
MRSFVLLFALFLSFTAQAADEARFPVTATMEGKDFVTGRKIIIPPDRGYKFSIVDAGTLRPYMKVYDSNGLEVQAFFALPSLVKAMTAEEKAEWEKKKQASERAREIAAANELKEDISSGLEATTRGAVVAKEGCCDVDDKNKQEPAETAEEDQPEEEVAKPKAADQALEIESPPEDFFDVSPRHAEAEAEGGQTPTAKKPEVKVLEVQSEQYADYVPDTGVIPAEKPKKDEKRSPAIQRPEPEKYVTLPDVVPIPRPKPRDLLDKASSARTRKQAQEAEDKQAEEEARQPRRPASEFLCRAYDAFKAKGVPEQALKQALMFLNKNKDKFGSKRYLSIADYSQRSTKKRFYLLDLKTFGVTREKVSHGSGNGNSGDPNHDGMLDRCGGSGSDRTRGGFFAAGDYYFSQKGRYKWPMLTKKPARNGLKLRGLTPGVNASAYSDGYVMHEAKYNSGGDAVMGRSNGCPAFIPGRGAPIVAKLQGGSLQYHYVPQCGEHHRQALKQVVGWESFCK